MAKTSKKQKGIFGAILLGGAGFGLYKLLGKKNALDNISYEVKRLKFAKITNILEIFAIKLKVDLNVINPTSSSLGFKSFVGNVFDKQTVIGSFKIYEPVVIKPRANTTIEVPVTVNSASAISSLYKAYTGGDTKSVTLKGLLKVGAFEFVVNKEIPITDV